MAPETVNLLMPFRDIEPEHRQLVGGKGLALAKMARSGLNVPQGAVVVTQAYDEFVASTGLRERISLELSRKKFEDMRWEELWDAALRIRNMFLRTPLGGKLGGSLEPEIRRHFANRPVVVRSSAPVEDSASASFAGLHESYVNVTGVSEIFRHIRLVWASLWTDRALLYRQELGLDVAQSTMAVVVQELISGERSGIAFSRAPNRRSQVAIEAVYGLNQGLVDGDVEPDRWMLERPSGRIVSHSPPSRESKAAPTDGGVSIVPLTPEERTKPPLDDARLGDVFDLALSAENHFESAQDVEWTFRGDDLYVLQSRPITRSLSEQDDGDREWYLSLSRTFENLKALRRKVEDERLPAMDSEAEALGEQDLSGLSDEELAGEIGRRRSIYQKWKDIYWDEFIPLAHGVRLFGQVYNDLVQPDDPFEFTNLLGATEMISLERNRALRKLAARVRETPGLVSRLREGSAEIPEELGHAIDAFIQDFGSLGGGPEAARDSLVRLLVEMATGTTAQEKRPAADFESLRHDFLSRFPADRQDYARDLLELGRASYRLRDNDNVHLRAVENEWHRAVEAGRERLRERGLDNAQMFSAEDVPKALRGQNVRPGAGESEKSEGKDTEISPRQLLGQPAGPGTVTGTAHVIYDEDDLFEVKSGEILVCDAVDPNMTFAVPLAAGIVERRGGMLIHGAIIAREYGLPCVTGVPNATGLIRTGDRLTVDGHLGIVVVRRGEGRAER